MTIRIGTIGRHTLIYGVGETLSRLASFLMLPLYTRFLTPSDYGSLELLSMVIDVTAMITGLGLAAGVFKFYTDAETDDGKKAVIATASLAVLALGLGTLAVGWMASPSLIEVILPGSRASYMRMVFLIYFVQAAVGVPFMFMRVREQSKAYVALNLVKLIGLLTLNILFVAKMEMGIGGVLLSNLIVHTVLALGLNFYMLREVGLRFSRTVLRAMGRFGFPLVFWSLANFILVFSDRFFLSQSAGTAAVGIYSLAYKFAFVLTAFAFTPFQMIWDAQRFSIARQANAQEIFRRVFLYLNVGLGFGALLIALFVKDFLRLMADWSYLSAYKLVPLILVAQILYLWTAYCNLGIFLQNRTRSLASLSGVTIAAVVILNVLLIPRFGVYGAAVATLVAYALRFVAIYILAQKLYHIDYRWSNVMKLYAMFAATFFLHRLFGELSIASSIAVSLAFAAVVGVLTYRHILDKKERDFISRVLFRRWTAAATQTSQA